MRFTLTGQPSRLSITVSRRSTLLASSARVAWAADLFGCGSLWSRVIEHQPRHPPRPEGEDGLPLASQLAPRARLLNSFLHGLRRMCSSSDRSATSRVRKKNRLVFESCGLSGRSLAKALFAAVSGKARQRPYGYPTNNSRATDFL